MKRESRRGFTLIELSIVLVIIGLVVGGVLVGQDLIKAAAVRAQISQIEKYNTAANTFRGKYGYLPGDIKDPDASNFGFSPRGSMPGEGDGNGMLQGIFSTGNPGNGGYFLAAGEEAMFWKDLSSAHLIEGSFIVATADTLPAPGSITQTSTPAIRDYTPEAKIGSGTYVYVWSEGGCCASNSTGRNFFGLSGITDLFPASGGQMPYTTTSLTVSQAYAIDKKMDDGFPQSGSVLAAYLQGLGDGTAWASGPNEQNGSFLPPPFSTATPGSNSTCFDNGGTAGSKQQYSVEVNNGNNLNCALSFEFQ